MDLGLCHTFRLGVARREPLLASSRGKYQHPIRLHPSVADRVCECVHVCVHVFISSRIPLHQTHLHLLVLPLPLLKSSSSSSSLHSLQLLSCRPCPPHCLSLLILLTTTSSSFFPLLSDLYNLFFTSLTLFSYSQLLLSSLCLLVCVCKTGQTLFIWCPNASNATALFTEAFLLEWLTCPSHSVIWLSLLHLVSYSNDTTKCDKLK